MFDAIVVGGGAAGLSVALVLGRSRRRVLVCDTGQPRNAPAPGVHGFFSRDGIQPAALLQIGREQLLPYESVELRTIEVVDAQRDEDHFSVTLADGTREAARKLVLASGVRDELPIIEGFAELWGTSVFHCPYCYGWEMRDQALAIYGKRTQALDLALLLTNWSRDLVLCSDGPAELDAGERQRLAVHDIPLREEPIARLAQKDGVLEYVVFTTGEMLPRRGLFLRPQRQQQSSLAQKLGCTVLASGKTAGLIDVDTNGWTYIPGLYAIGDMAHPLHWVSLAVAQGASTGIAISNDLLQEDLSAREQYLLRVI